MTTDEKISHIFRQHQTKHPRAIFIEKGAQQMSLHETLIRETIARGVYANIIPVDSENNDKIARASSVQQLFESGVVICIKGRYPAAIEELVRITEPNYPDDMADAIVYCVKQAQMWYLPKKGERAEAKKEDDECKEPSRIQLALKRKKAARIHPITGQRISEDKWQPQR
jgi:predicted phage terminase large subunit-like protein